VTCDPGQLPASLLQVLAPEHWPVRPDSLPPGTAVVGGAVRDALLGRLAAQPDLDLVVQGDAVALARALAKRQGGSVVVLDAKRSIARLVVGGWTIDLARRIGDSLEEDLLRRDYGANAIALELPAEGKPPTLRDPSGGLADLAAGDLRALGETNLLEDPLRLLRGVRLACELGFRIEATTWGLIVQHHQRLGHVAGERVLAELERMATAPAGGAGLARVLEADLLAGWGQAAGPGSEAEQASLKGLDGAAAAERQLRPDEAATALPLARLATLLEGPTLERLRSSRRLQQRCHLGVGIGPDIIGLQQRPGLPGLAQRQNFPTHPGQHRGIGGEPTRRVKARPQRATASEADRPPARPEAKNAAITRRNPHRATGIAAHGEIHLTRRDSGRAAAG
jgi:tRNA nucleotidyltransferase (CCA-adding enzyme)